jgi:hypothetical protein
MKHRTLQILFTYWNGLRAGRIAPLRPEIDPARIGAILPEIFLLERVDATTYSYRLAGTRLCEIFGSELRGTNMLDGWAATDRASLQRDLTLVCEQGAGIHLVMEGSADSTRRVELEAILLPLMHGENAIGRVIGAMSPVASPHWLGHDHLRSKRIVSRDVVWPDGRPNSAIAASAEAAPPPSGPPAGLARGDRRSFRVLTGGRKED